MPAAFYFDWNVISYLNDPANLTPGLAAQAVLLKALLDQAVDPRSMVVPYSYGHFHDIRKGPASLHEKWLGYLSRTTRGWRISELPEDRERVGVAHIADPLTDFNAYVADLEESEALESRMAPLREPFLDSTAQQAVGHLDIEPDNPNRDLLQPLYAKIKSGAKLTGFDALELNRKMRHSMRDQSGRPYRFPREDFDLRDRDYAAVLARVDSAVARSDFPYVTFRELEDSIPEISTFGFLSPFTERVNKLSITGTLLGIGVDKLAQPSDFQSVINDLIHLSLGLRADGFVTEDKKLKERALLIRAVLGLRVEVLSIDELNCLIMSDLSKYYATERGQKAGALEIVFVDEDGTEIRRIRIGPESTGHDEAN